MQIIIGEGHEGCAYRRAMWPIRKGAITESGSWCLWRRFKPAGGKVVYLRPWCWTRIISYANFTLMRIFQLNCLYERYSAYVITCGVVQQFYEPAPKITEYTKRKVFPKFKFNSVARVVIVNFFQLYWWAGCSTTEASLVWVRSQC